MTTGAVVFAITMLGMTGQAYAQARAQATTPPTSTTVTAFVDVAVIPMDSARVLTHQTVLIRDGRIAAVGTVNQVSVPQGAQVIDGRGKYLMPGLADMHVHPFMTGVFDNTKFMGYLAHGVTTIRDMHSGGSDGEALRVKRAVANGTLLGPRVYTAGDLTIPMQPATRGAVEVDVVDSNADMGAIVDSLKTLKAAGHEFVKLYAFPHPAYDTIVAASRRLGLRVSGHVPSIYGALSSDEVDLTRVLQDRWASIEHVTGYFAHLTGGFPEMLSAVFPPDWMKPMLDTAAWARPGYEWNTSAMRAIADTTREAGVWNCPTLTVLTMLTNFMEFTKEPAATWTRPPGAPSWLQHWMDFIFKMTKALQDAGAGLLLGTDDFGTAPDELRLLVEEAGLTPYQALAAGTRNAAVFLGTLDSTGTVAVGKRADLVLLADNPLQHIRATAVPTGVMVGGRWLSRSDLDGLLPKEP